MAEHVPAAAGASQLIELRDDQLLVSAASTAVAPELRLRAAVLLGALAAAPGGLRARELRVVVRQAGPGRRRRRARVDSDPWRSDSTRSSASCRMASGWTPPRTRSSSRSPRSAPPRAPRATCTRSPRREGRISAPGTPRACCSRRSSASTTTTSRPGSRSAWRRPSGPRTGGCVHRRELHLPPGQGIGAVVAVVRERELYVATVGDADAFLARQGAPADAARGRPGAGAADARTISGSTCGAASCWWATRCCWPPASWRSGWAPTSSARPSPRCGPHRRRSTCTTGSWPRAAEGSDALMVMEASEVPATRVEHRLVPVRPGRAAGRGPGAVADPAGGLRRRRGHRGTRHGPAGGRCRGERAGRARGPRAGSPASPRPRPPARAIGDGPAGRGTAPRRVGPGRARGPARGRRGVLGPERRVAGQDGRDPAGQHRRAGARRRPHPARPGVRRRWGPHQGRPAAGPDHAPWSLDPARRRAAGGRRRRHGAVLPRAGRPGSTSCIRPSARRPPPS